MAEGERRATVGVVEASASTSTVEGKMEIGRTAVMLVCGSLVYYHCAYRGSSLLSLVSDVLLVLLCSLAILGMLFRQMNITTRMEILYDIEAMTKKRYFSVPLGGWPTDYILIGGQLIVPVDPLEWQISQDTAIAIVACLANTVGAAESVLRVAATGHDKRLFFKVSLTLYLLSALGRVASGATIAYVGLCLSCLYFFAQSSGLLSSYPTQFLKRRETTGSGVQDAM